MRVHGFKFLDATCSFIGNDSILVLEANSSTSRSSPNSGKCRANLARSTEPNMDLTVERYQRSPVTPKVADLHINSFRIDQISFSAVFANARALGLGFGLSRRLGNKSRLRTRLVCSRPNQLARSYQRFAFVSRDLRSTVSQITKEHRPYLVSLSLLT